MEMFCANECCDLHQVPSTRVPLVRVMERGRHREVRQYMFLNYNGERVKLCGRCAGAVFKINGGGWEQDGQASTAAENPFG